MRTTSFKHFMIFVFLSSLLIVSYSLKAQTDQNEALYQVMSLLKSETMELGGPSLQNGNARLSILKFGQTPINGNYKIVDDILKKDASQATIFIKKGKVYVSISTNIIKADGSRAIGTILTADSPEIKAINQGTTFIGKGAFSGKTYKTLFEPIVNEQKEVVGMYYVGVHLSNGYE